MSCIVLGILAGMGRAAVLATRALATSRLYHDALDKHGWPLLDQAELQDQVDALITRFKSDGTTATTLQRWGSLRTYLETQGISHVILACTDLAFCASTGQRGKL